MSKQFTIYNTASRKKEPFKSDRDIVGMYCCGPTVYNYAHIGNLRTYIFEDILKRVLLLAGFKVKHVVNITDVGHLTSDADTGEDKMEKGAAREGKTVWEIAEHYTDKFKENIKDLNILEPDVWPKATDHIAEMISLVETLQEKGVTYTTGDGIYFDTTKFPSYCDFAGLDPENLRAGVRVDMGEKKNITDFALWKYSPTDVKREMEWDSPWGVGFPGWHIECSAMSMKHLQFPIDIHCGGVDHIRVHHTNEIAQSEVASGKKFVNYWAHGEFLTLSNSKMAKSEGGFITLDVLKEKGFSPLAYRYFCFSAHYRNPLNFSWENIKSSAKSLQNLKKIIQTEIANVPNGDVDLNDLNLALNDFYNAVYDDLNMPKALASVWDLVKSKAISSNVKKKSLEIMDSVLGLDLLDNFSDKPVVDTDDSKTIKVINSTSRKDVDNNNIFTKVKDRRLARKEKRFAEADSIRDQLNSLGITINDLPDGTTECIVRQLD